MSIKNRRNKEKVAKLIEENRLKEQSKNKDRNIKTSVAKFDGVAKVPLYAFRPIVLCKDKKGILNSIETCKKLIKSIEKLALIIAKEDYEKTLDRISQCELEINRLEDQVEISYYIAHIKSLTLVIFFNVHYGCMQVLKNKSKSRLKIIDLAKDIRGVDLKLSLANTNPESVIVDLEKVLEDLGKFVPELKIKLPKKKRIKPKNKAYKSNNNEWTPNSPQSNDILSAIIKPHLWTEEKDKLKYFITHSKQQSYSQLSLLKTDSTGDIVPNDNYSADHILDGFDLRDRKILRLLMIEAVQHKGELFDISGKWVLDMIGDNRSSVKRNGKRLTALEKLEDLERRLWSYDTIKFHWRYKVGKKEFNNLPDGFPIKASFKIFGINGISINKDGRGYELTATITPSDWFEFNQKTLQQFTKIPKQLLAIDIYKYPRAYLIGERICELFRINKQHLAKNGNNYQTPLTITVKSLLNEIITPDDLDKAKSDSVKGCRLKERIIEDTKFLANLLNWQFNWQGIKSGDNFTSFYTSASFTVILDCELESEILGEKVIKTKPQKVKTPLYLDGEQVKALRKKLKLTQEYFGKTLGYSKSYISKLESGREIVTQEFIKIVFSKYSEQLKNI